jgi:hypothetical protein
MNSSRRFWARASDWPRDAKEFIFLARAVDAIGKAIFPDDWTGTEPYIDPLSITKLEELIDQHPHFTSQLERYRVGELAASNTNGPNY